MAGVTINREHNDTMTIARGKDKEAVGITPIVRMGNFIEATELFK